MLRRGLATALIAATGLTWAGAAVAEDSCKLVKTAELPLRFENNQPMVQVTLNGKPAWFLIETGASFSNIYRDATSSFGLTETSRDRLKIYGVGGMQTAMQVIVSELDLGGSKVKDFRLLALSRGGPSAYAGQFGRDFLRNVGDIELDLAGGFVRFWKADHCEHRSLAYWTKAPAMAELDHYASDAPYLVKTTVNGLPVQATLETGTASTIVTPGIARQPGVPPSKYEPGVRYLTGIGTGRVPAHVAGFDAVSIGQEEVKHVRLLVADMGELDTLDHTASKLETRVATSAQPDMVLGGDFLRSHRVLIAVSQGLLYFTYNGGPIFQPPALSDAPKSEDTAPPAPAK